MAMNLREALTDFAHDWRDDLSPAWRALLGDAQPDPLAVASSLSFDAQQPIYPGRRAQPLPGARADAHVFRAFDGIAPSQVRCVLIGQDPYPLLARATGRAFEQGDLPAWTLPAADTETSLRALLGMLLAARTGDADVVELGWAALLALAATPAVSLEPPAALFDWLQAQGVLCLNAGLTQTRYRVGGAPEQIKGHLPFWRPVVGQMLRGLAARTQGHVVFLCLGAAAHKLLLREQVRGTAITAGTWERRAIDISLPHPAASTFVRAPNPFVAVNAQLAMMNAVPIAW